MNSGIHSPLGQDRKPPRERRKVFTYGRFFTALAVVGIAAISIYPTMRPDKLEKPEVARLEKKTDPIVDQEPVPDVKTAESDPTQFDKLTRSKPTDGANVERQVMEDGSIVTKITPKDRNKDGPVIIDAKANGPQDVKAAAIPDPDLIEDTPDGKLPVISVDGLRSFERYARPWSGARGTRIAIVIGGLGLSQTSTQRALKILPEEITLAFAANGNSLGRWMPEARRGGHEILLQVPMEPFDYPDNDPGPLTLIHANAPDQNIALLHQSMAKMTNYTGIMNYLGGQLLANPSALEPVMRDIGQRGLLFLDDGSSAQSLSATYAKAFTMPHAFADVVLDGEVNKAAILKKLDELERIAFRKGTAIGVASGFDESVDAIAEWAKEAGDRGIEIVGVSALTEVPN
ncbi:MAG: hypothetical protein JWM58_1053 [Rhizobium sp.]|nr:hypothetical protein [Rhizobium sp.]